MNATHDLSAHGSLVGGGIQHGRATATVHCQHCPWKAQLTDDSILEVVTILRRFLVDHVHARHPEHGRRHA